jgi:tetratricopeptide (TPR) repeat protein
MRIITSLLFVIAMFAFPSLVAASPRDELTQKIAQLKAKPNDTALREAIIKLAQEIKPSPGIPEEARQKFVEGNTIAKSAKGPSGQKLAIKRYQEALAIAPWWGDAYYNLGTAQELAGQFDAAKTSFKLYILTNPGEKEARDAQDRIYALNAKADLAKTEQNGDGPKQSKPAAASTPPAPAASAESQRWNGRWQLTTFNPEFNPSAGYGGVLQSTQIGNVIEFWTTGSVSMLVLRGTISTTGSVAWELNNQSCGMPPVSVAVSPDFNTLQYSSSINSFNCSNDSGVTTTTLTRQ